MTHKTTDMTLVDDPSKSWHAPQPNK